jgi:ribosome-binding factor A
VSPRSRGHSTGRQFPRTARLNHLLQEILAEALERVDDERLAMVTITGVKAEPDLHQATVFFDDPASGARDDEVLAAFEDVRARLQATVNREARLKRTPTLAFEPDQGTRQGARIEEILRDLGTDRAIGDELAGQTEDRDRGIDTDIDSDRDDDGG